MAASDSGEEMQRKRGRPKASSDDQKRSHIVENAGKIFVKHGYAASTTAIVAAEAGVSKQTLYRIFESKEELFAAVVGDHRRMMLDLPRQPEQVPVSLSLERIFMIDMDEDKDMERAGLLQLVFREAPQFPELIEILNKEGLLAARQLLTDWLAERRAEGRLKLDDTASGSRMLMDMIFGGMGPPEGRASAWPDRTARLDHLRRCIAVFCKGVEAD
ncbi:TetR/AcrR family transcriptional regulator [Rhizobium sp. CF142]|uniref:TetR/AcrR family transcriptional regulator n=1 Tax=Rhizobium sp. CF142 TaxID=1144314 RepID=UPI00026EFBDF|nr:TetR/AcrR family transcriptional regulator [Rhizobium sp. CF142]EJJ26479.1 transcriptional regulator [Rhizobium sp. CF142]